MKNKSLLVLTLTLACLTLLGCPKKSDQIVLKIGHGLDVTHPVHKALLFMGEKLREKSNGKITLEIYPSEVLGSEREMIEQVQQGFLDMTKTSSSPLESFIPGMGVFSVPYVFRDHEHFWKVLKGPIGISILKAGKEKNMIGLCYYDSGSRSFYTKDRPILKPDDLKNPTPLKIRVQESKTSMAMVKALGASPTPIAWGELYTALQTGIVDGAENNPPSLYTSRHYEVCKHYSLDEHTRVPDVVLIGTKSWNKLSPEDQQILQDAANESADHERILWDKFTQESLDKIKEAGVKIYYPDKSLFREKVKSMHQSYKGTEIGSLIEEIQLVK